MPADFNPGFYGPKELPNEGSKHQTPASLYIDAHYNNLEIVERWSWERYARLCNVLKMTPWELASLVCLPHKLVLKFERDNCLPGYGRRPIALLLTVMEAHLLSALHHDVINNPFPNLSRSPAQAEPISQDPSPKQTSPASSLGSAGCVEKSA